MLKILERIAGNALASIDDSHLVIIIPNQEYDVTICPIWHSRYTRYIIIEIRLEGSLPLSKEIETQKKNETLEEWIGKYQELACPPASNGTQLFERQSQEPSAKPDGLQ